MNKRLKLQNEWKMKKKESEAKRKKITRSIKS